MFRLPCQRIILVFALFALVGGQRGVVQCVAWGKMLYERTAESSFAEAVASTFSGEEPCEICTALRESNGEDKKTPAPLPSVKIDLAPIATSHFIPASRPVIAIYPELLSLLASASLGPPIPPPPELA